MPEKDNEQTLPREVDHLPHKVVIRLKLCFGAIVILLLGCAGLLIFGHQKIDNLNYRYASLSTKEHSLKAQNKKLSTMNSNLQKSYTALQNAQKSRNNIISVSGTSSISSVGSSTNESTSSFSIVNVQVEPESYFGDTGPSSSTELLAVMVTIKNLTTTNQNYFAGDFRAITSSGEVKEAIIWGGQGTGSLWNNSTVIPGGSATVVITFLDSDYINDGFTTIEFTPNNSSSEQSLPLPAPIN